jgi:hypothetical protein
MYYAPTLKSLLHKMASFSLSLPLVLMFLAALILVPQGLAVYSSSKPIYQSPSHKTPIYKPPLIYKPPPFHKPPTYDLPPKFGKHPPAKDDIHF